MLLLLLVLMTTLSMLGLLYQLLLLKTSTLDRQVIARYVAPALNSQLETEGWPRSRPRPCRGPAAGNGKRRLCPERRRRLGVNVGTVDDSASDRVGDGSGRRRQGRHAYGFVRSGVDITSTRPMPPSWMIVLVVAASRRLTTGGRCVYHSCWSIVTGSFGFPRCRGHSISDVFHLILGVEFNWNIHIHKRTFNFTTFLIQLKNIQLPRQEYNSILIIIIIMFV